MFWLVQRLICKERPEDEPSPLAPTRSMAGRFDDQFGCDYMGNSMFEWGAIPKAFDRMHGLALELKSAEIIRKGVTRTVYFVAPSNPEGYQACEGDLGDGEVTNSDQAIEEFKHWFGSNHLFGEEQPHFEYYFADDWSDLFPKGNICAWWSLDDNIAWSLDARVAMRLLVAFSMPGVAA